MNVREIMSRVRQCGAALTVVDGRLKAAPPGVIPQELKAVIRERAPEIKAFLTGCRAEQAPEETGPLPALLVAVADAIASAKRSPFLDDLAIARAARSYVEAERAIRVLPEAARYEALRRSASVLREAVDAIRAQNYERAYALLDSLKPLPDIRRCVEQ